MLDVVILHASGSSNLLESIASKINLKISFSLNLANRSDSECMVGIRLSWSACVYFR